MYIYIYLFFFKFFSHLGYYRIMGGQNQDGILGGRGIRVSSQLGHLPATGGGPLTHKGTGGTPSDWEGRGVWGE